MLAALRKERAAGEELAAFDREHFDEDLGWQLYLYEHKRPLCPPSRQESPPKRQRVDGGVASCDASDPCEDGWDNKDKCRMCRSKAGLASYIATACSAARPSLVLSYST